MLLTSETPLEPSLVFFDADIQEGCTYKYWVSAWDDPEWNNESAWSASVTIGVPTEAQPQIPDALNIKMLSKELPDLSLLPPGIVLDTKMTDEILAMPMVQALPIRQYDADVDTETVKAAELESAVSIGQFISGAANVSLASRICLAYDNLPEDRYIHMFVAIRGEDVKAGGNAYLKWPAYSGGGVKGYVVYKPEFSGAMPDLDTMQTMTRKDLTEMCGWRKVSDAITQNLLLVSGLNNAPGSVNLFLVCLEPVYNFSSSKYIANMNVDAVSTDSAELVEPVKPKEPKPPSLSDCKPNVPGTVTVNSQGSVCVTVPGEYGFNGDGKIYVHTDHAFTEEILKDPRRKAQNTLECLGDASFIFDFDGVGWLEIGRAHV
jgi:hypothetical protein